MLRVLWVVTIICAAIGGFFFVSVIKSANGAPQEAAGAAMALCMAVIPYVISRAVSELNK